MFAKSFITLLSAAALFTSATAKPLTFRRSAVAVPVQARTDSSRSYSMNSWGGHSSMDNFDNFHGSDNFDGSRNKQVIIKKDELVCHEQKVEIVQQKLTVLREMAKRCVETLRTLL